MKSHLITSCVIGASLLLTGCLNETPKGLLSEEDAYDNAVNLYINSVATLYNYIGGHEDSHRMAMLSSVRVRGTTSLTGGNDPLVIIDGVSCDLATLSSIYPADIESFTILKNAAETAQYGSRGASGVIEVTTKKGKGGKFHINYSGIFGFESVYKNLHMLNRADYITTAQNLGLAYNDKGYDTDFLSAITRTGLVQNHHVAFSGGSDQSNYRASVAIMDYNTIIRNNKHTNYVAKLDITQKAFNDLMTFELGVFGSSQKSNNLFDVQKLFYSAATQNPTFPYDEDALGTWKKNSTASQITAPDAVMNMKNDEQNMHFNTHARLTFDLTSLFPSSEKTQKGIESLLLKVFGSYSYSSTEDAQFCPTWTWAQGRALNACLATISNNNPRILCLIIYFIIFNASFTTCSTGSDG